MTVQAHKRTQKNLSRFIALVKLLKHAQEYQYICTIYLCIDNCVRLYKNFLVLIFSTVHNKGVSKTQLNSFTCLQLSLSTSFL